MSCIDCAAAGRALTRPAPFPGPRCATDNREHRLAQKARRRATYSHTNYGINADQQSRQLEWQHGVCAICRRATGAAKALAHDHNHETGEFRGDLCGPCNQDLIGRYDAETLIRAALYLISPPSRKALARKLVDGEWRWASPIPSRLRTVIIPPAAVPQDQELD